MLNNVLWALHTKQMHDMQKAQGLAGLLGLLLAIVSVWKWNSWLYPLFDQVGLVNFAKDIGLIHEYGAITILNVFLMIALSSLVVGLSLLTLILLLTFLGALVKSKMVESTVSFICGILAFILAIIFWVPLFIYARLSPKYPSKTSDTKNVDTLDYFKEYPVDKMESYYKQGLSRKISLSFDEYRGPDLGALKLYKSLVERSDAIPEPLTVQEAQNKLQRVTAASLDGAMLGYHKLHGLLLLLPNPLPPMGSNCISLVEPESVDFGFNVESSLYYIQHKNQMSSQYTVMSVKTTFMPTANGVKPTFFYSGPTIAVSLNECSHLYYFTDDYTVDSLNELIKYNTDLQTCIKNAHLAYYVLPIILRYNEYEQPADDFMQIFYKEWGQTADAEKYFGEYARNVEGYVRKYANMGESWAKKWVKEVG